MNYYLTNKVIENIDNYLNGTNIKVEDILIEEKIAIYGGAVRDSIADKEIHDIDIMCLSKSSKIIRNFLIKNKFREIDLYDSDKIKMYEEINIINEPWTFIKNDKIIQIIRPRNYDFNYILSNVDISACGVFLQKKSGIKLFESYPNAISHCRSEIFKILKGKSMYNDMRTLKRSYKLVSRGWKDISNVKKREVRKIKLINIGDKQKPDYNYKNYYSNDEPDPWYISDISL